MCYRFPLHVANILCAFCTFHLNIQCSLLSVVQTYNVVQYMFFKHTMYSAVLYLLFRHTMYSAVHCLLFRHTMYSAVHCLLFRHTMYNAVVQTYNSGECQLFRHTIQVNASCSDIQDRWMPVVQTYNSGECRLFRHTIQVNASCSDIQGMWMSVVQTYKACECRLFRHTMQLIDCCLDRHSSLFKEWFSFLCSSCSKNLHDIAGKSIKHASSWVWFTGKKNYTIPSYWLRLTTFREFKLNTFICLLDACRSC